MDVGVRELKQHLSAYLDRAAAGEVIRVTDRGKVKALIAPVGDPSRQLDRGIEEGWIRPPATPGGLVEVERVRGTMRTLDALTEDRAA